MDKTFREGLPCNTESDRVCPPGQSCYSVGGEDLCFKAPPADAAVADASQIDASPPDAAIPDALPPDAIPGDAMMCDPLVDTCGTGLTCRVEMTGGTCESCCGTVTSGMPCTEHADCEEGFGCHPDPMMTKRCSRYCDTTADNCSTFAALDVCQPLQGNLGLCVFGGCDPLAQNCGATEACYYNGTTGMTLCAPPGSGQQDDTCTMPNSCAKTLGCYDCSGTDRCGLYCNRQNGDADCSGLPGSPACIQIDGDLGVCDPCPAT